MTAWKSIFHNHILDRGYDYYQNHQVENLKIDYNTIRALVFGSEKYEVFIEMDNGDIVTMSCTCPHAKSGNNCKHMAAVLFS